MREQYLYHKPTELSLRRMDAIRLAVDELHTLIVANSAPCREQALALTNLEQAAMWANKAVIACQGNS